MPASRSTAHPRFSREAREAQVLDTAARLFYERGVHEVGMDELVRASGLGKASVYRLYPTKDALIAAYLRRQADDTAAAIAERIAEHAEDPRGALLAIVDDIADDIARPDFRGCAFNNASIEFDDREHAARVEARSYRTNLLATLTELAEQLAPGHGRPLGARLAVVIDGCYTNAAHLGADGPAEEGLALARRLINDA